VTKRLPELDQTRKLVFLGHFTEVVDELLVTERTLRVSPSLFI